MIGYKLSPVLEDIADTLWEFEGQYQQPHEFTEAGTRAALKIFSSAMQDALWKKLEAQQVDLGQRTLAMTGLGNRLRMLFYDYTGIDLHDKKE